MKQKNSGKISEHANGLGAVTSGMIEERAREIAVINGRPAGQVNENDREEARHDLLGQSLENPLDFIPESQRWDSNPASVPHMVERLDSDDEQTIAELLVSEGVEEAEHDQMVEASRQQT